MPIPGILSPMVFRPVVVPGSIRLDVVGPFNFVVPHFNLLTIELYGGGAGGAVPETTIFGNAGNSTIVSLGLSAGGATWVGGSPVRGVASGGNDTNNSGRLAGDDAFAPVAGGRCNGPLGGLVQTSQGSPGNIVGGGGHGGQRQSPNIGFGLGGASGAYVKSVYTPSQINVGTILSGTVGAGGTGGNGGDIFFGPTAGARGDAVLTWS